MTGTIGAVFAAAVFFVASHFVLSSRLLRTPLAAHIGETGFRILHSAVSLVVLVWLVRSYAEAPYVELWPPGAWARAVPLAVMPFAAILLACGLTTRSPTAIGGEPPPAGEPAQGILKLTRHPVLWAIGLWAVAHIPPNGDAASIIFFGAFAVLAFAGMPMLDRKLSEKLGAAWGPIALTTSVLPFAAMLSGRARLGFDEIGSWRILAGVALYLALLVAHGPVIGLSALPG